MATSDSTMEPRISRVSTPIPCARRASDASYNCACSFCEATWAKSDPQARGSLAACSCTRVSQTRSPTALARPAANSTVLRTGCEKSVATRIAMAEVVSTSHAIKPTAFRFLLGEGLGARHRAPCGFVMKLRSPHFVRRSPRPRSFCRRLLASSPR